MLSDRAYHIIVSILEMFMWDGELIGGEHLQEGPAVIVANHMGSIGPVGICSSLPMRVYPWILGETVDKLKAPENVRKDFVEKVLHVDPPLSQAIAEGLCKISTPLLLGLGCIPVPESLPGLDETFRTSLKLLKEGKWLLVVPEERYGDPDPVTGIKKFKHGFVRLGEQYYAETGGRLPFYPVTIHEGGLVIVGEPLIYNPLIEARQQRIRMASILEETIKGMHIEATQNLAIQPIFSRHKIS